MRKIFILNRLHLRTKLLKETGFHNQTNRVKWCSFHGAQWRKGAVKSWQRSLNLGVEVRTDYTLCLETRLTTASIPGLTLICGFL